MGFVIAGLALFVGAALPGGGGYTWLVAFTGALAVLYGASTMVLRSPPQVAEQFTGPKGAAQSGPRASPGTRVSR